MIRNRGGGQLLVPQLWDTTYYYCAISYYTPPPGVKVDPGGNSELSNVVGVTTLPAQNPFGFTATVLGGSVVLSWDPVPAAVHYILQGPGVDTLAGPGDLVAQGVQGPTLRIRAIFASAIVRGLPPGTHSWTLLTSYLGPDGEFSISELPPAMASVTLPGVVPGTEPVTGTTSFGFDPVTPCGHYGERACCWLETSFGACTDGLIETGGCTGNCRCGGSIFNSSGTCTTPPPVTPGTEPVTGTTSFWPWEW